MSTTTTTKYATNVNTAGGWTNFTVARLNADDGSTATKGTGTTGVLDTFALGIPSGDTITEVTLEVDQSAGLAYLKVYRSASYVTLITCNQINSATITTDLPSVAELNAASTRVECLGFTSGTWFDYVRVKVKHYAPAVVTTSAATDIEQDSATVAGETTSDGDGTISSRGVCWNTSGNPTKSNSYATSGSGIGTFSCDLTGLWASTTYYVRSWATTEDGTAYGNEVSFTTDGSGSKSLVARPFTTRAAAAENVVRAGGTIIDWWFDGEVARAELRPTDVADIPRSRWYVVSRDTSGASVSVTMDSEDTPDIVCVVYRTYGVTGVRDGTVRRVYSPAAPTSAIQRVQLVDLTGQYMGETDAVNYAENVLARVAADVISASITVRGGLYTVDGAWRPAPLILAGDWIDVVDLPGHTPIYITGTTYSRAESMVTITTGNKEQRDLVIPGITSLPRALQVYGHEVAYDSHDGGTTGGTGETKGTYDTTLNWKKVTTQTGGGTIINPPVIPPAQPVSPSGYDPAIWGPAALDPDWEPYTH